MLHEGAESNGGAIILVPEIVLVNSGLEQKSMAKSGNVGVARDVPDTAIPWTMRSGAVILEHKSIQDNGEETDRPLVDQNVSLKLPSAPLMGTGAAERLTL